ASHEYQVRARTPSLMVVFLQEEIDSPVQYREIVRLRMNSEDGPTFTHFIFPHRSANWDRRRGLSLRCSAARPHRIPCWDFSQPPNSSATSMAACAIRQLVDGRRWRARSPYHVTKGPLWQVLGFGRGRAHGFDPAHLSCLRRRRDKRAWHWRSSAPHRW